MRVHSRLEAVLRPWAKECKAIAEEVVFEAEVEDRESVVNFLSSHLKTTSRLWLLLRPCEKAGIEIVSSDELTRILAGVLEFFEMVSLVNPSTGGGLTIDVSDEGEQHPILQIAGWREYTVFTESASDHFPRVHWIKEIEKKGSGSSVDAH